MFNKISSFTSIVIMGVILLLAYRLLKFFGIIGANAPINTDDITNDALTNADKMINEKGLKPTSLHYQRAKDLSKYLNDFTPLLSEKNIFDNPKKFYSFFQGMNGNDTLLVYKIFGKQKIGMYTGDLIYQIQRFTDKTGYNDYWEKIRPYFISAKLISK
jgi:hypothetical protein